MSDNNPTTIALTRHNESHFRGHRLPPSGWPYTHQYLENAHRTLSSANFDFETVSCVEFIVYTPIKKTETNLDQRCTIMSSFLENLICEVDTHAHVCCNSLDEEDEDWKRKLEKILYSGSDISDDDPEEEEPDYEEESNIFHDVMDVIWCVNHDKTVENLSFRVMVFLSGYFNLHNAYNTNVSPDYPRTFDNDCDGVLTYLDSSHIKMIIQLAWDTTMENRGLAPGNPVKILPETLTVKSESDEHLTRLFYRAYNLCREPETEYEKIHHAFGTTR